MTGIPADTRGGGDHYWASVLLWCASFVLLCSWMSALGVPWPNREAFWPRATALAVLWALSFGIWKAAIAVIATLIRSAIRVADRNGARVAGMTGGFFTALMEIAPKLGMPNPVELVRSAGRVLASFGAFRPAFARKGEAGRSEGARTHGQHRSAGANARTSVPPDPFLAACRLVGLPESGEFTAAEFKQRFHTLMKAVHPDIAGPNLFAQQLNAARAVIKKRKGWK